MFIWFFFFFIILPQFLKIIALTSDFISSDACSLWRHKCAHLMTCSSFRGCSSVFAAKKRAAAAILFRGNCVNEWNTKNRCMYTMAVLMHSWVLISKKLRKKYSANFHLNLEKKRMKKTKILFVPEKLKGKKKSLKLFHKLSILNLIQLQNVII